MKRYSGLDAMSHEYRETRSEQHLNEYAHLTEAVVSTYLSRVTAAYIPWNGFGGSTGKSDPRTGPGYFVLVPAVD